MKKIIKGSVTEALRQMMMSLLRSINGKVKWMNNRSKLDTVPRKIQSNMAIDISDCVMKDEQQQDDDDDDKDEEYPDLMHSLFEVEEELEELDQELQVSNSREDFKLEDEIDHVADLFIHRFHRQMRLQKLLSFKRYQDMLARSH